MKKELEQLLGMPVHLTPWTKKEELPLYLGHGREFWVTSVGRINFLLVTFSIEGRLNAQQLSAQVKKIERIAEMPVALQCSHLTFYQREALIRKGIPFVLLPNHVYLPFLGVVMQTNLAKEEKVVPEKMQAATQMVFLYLFYQREYIPQISKSELAQKLGLSKTSITRAVEQLSFFQLLQKEESIRTPISLVRGEPLKRAVRELLIDPVQKRILVLRKELPDSVLLAGESCLSEYSMLNNPSIEVYACDKKQKWIDQCTEVIPLLDIGNYVELELWKYPPELFATDGKVDILSLYCSLKANLDERVEGELESLLEEIKW